MEVAVFPCKALGSAMLLSHPPVKAQQLMVSSSRKQVLNTNTFPDNTVPTELQNVDPPFFTAWFAISEHTLLLSFC